MPHRKTPLIKNNFYHIYNRGNNRENIFFERENYIYFLNLMKLHLVNNVHIIAYCLMPNHYHFLLYLQNEKISNSMKSLSLAYTKAINKKLNRSGVLFQGRFQSIHIQETEYLINLVRYIHLNPIKAGIVDQIDQWEFSSYPEYAGLRQGGLPTTEYIKMQINDQIEYQKFLTDEKLATSEGFYQLLIDN
jgi:putative transposase